MIRPRRNLDLCTCGAWDDEERMVHVGPNLSMNRVDAERLGIPWLPIHTDRCVVVIACRIVAS